MKRHYKILIWSLAFAALAGCSESMPGVDTEEPVAVTGAGASLGERDGENTVKNRALNDFIVNKAADPTHAAISDRTLWSLGIQIMKSGAAYIHGTDTMKYDPSSEPGKETWIPSEADKIYFPNYKNQLVKATLFSPSWTNTIAKDQSTSANLLAQDVLVQNGSNGVTISPAHIIPNIQLRHAYSMLDFILTDVDRDEIQNVEVLVGTDIYQPYYVDGLPNAEYLVILPLRTANPKIRVTTKEGAVYTETVYINGTAINTCYCVKLVGIELKLSSVVVINWYNGSALSGQYSTITSYPTFRGTAGVEATFTYDNGLTQDITFNDRGEITVKPFGRIITKIETQDGTQDNLRIVLNSMIVDLTDYL